VNISPRIITFPFPKGAARPSQVQAVAVKSWGHRCPMLTFHGYPEPTRVGSRRAFWDREKRGPLAPPGDRAMCSGQPIRHMKKFAKGAGYHSGYAHLQVSCHREDGAPKYATHDCKQGQKQQERWSK